MHNPDLKVENLSDTGLTEGNQQYSRIVIWRCSLPGDLNPDQFRTTIVVHRYPTSSRAVADVMGRDGDWEHVYAMPAASWWSAAPGYTRARSERAAAHSLSLCERLLAGADSVLYS